jgi:predicted SprT family Zn-dependent metalloprotease
MNDEQKHSPNSPLAIGDTVTFSHRERTWTGTVVRKGRTYVDVVCDAQRRFRVPYALLMKVGEGAPRFLSGAHEHHRSRVQSGDRVQFAFRGAVMHGVVARLNPQRAHVIVDDGREYRVSYALLQHLERPPAGTLRRSVAEMEEIATRARKVLAQHQLLQWSFQFDNGRKRAGCCQYDTQVISLSYEFAESAPADEIHDTILHEVAHALVGKAHNHDEIWRTKALEIGCTGRRCHDLQFSTPRYIMQCERGCWVATAERRRRGIICKRCQGQIVYATYTEERWRQAREQLHLSAP